MRDLTYYVRNVGRMKLRNHLARDCKGNLGQLRLQGLKIVPAYQVERQVPAEQTHHVLSASFNTHTAHNASDADINGYEYCFGIITFKLYIVNPHNPGAVCINDLLIENVP